MVGERNSPSKFPSREGVYGNAKQKVLKVINKLINNIKGDRWIWGTILILFIFSLLAVYSSTGTLAYRTRGGQTEFYLIKQLILMFGGLALIYGVHMINYKYFSRISQIFYYGSIILLAITLIFGTDINQAKRWLTLPVINLTMQTSDFAKLALTMYLARVLSKKQDVIKDFREGFWNMIIPVFIICALIAPEDMSTALIIFATSVLILFIGRVSLVYIGGLFVISILGLVLAITLLMNMPEEKMVSRMLTWKGRIEVYQESLFGDAESKKLAEPFQVTQAKIAIAKGGIFPNGPGNSTQKNFLPHAYSDYIYVIIIEEYGLIGGTFVLFLYLFFLFRTALMIKKAPKAFGAILAFSLALSLVIQAMMNMGVAVNLLPVTGLTLPLVSMGGSSTLFTSIAFGIVLSVSRDIETSKEKMVELVDEIAPE